MNNKTDIDVQYVSPLKKICMTIGELPSSYLETMSYYEMLVWFTEYIKNTLIPTINNNAEAVQELQSLYEELRTYINDYFDNLDVQEEINNKLDAMVEDGTLTELIGDYIDDYIAETNEKIDTFENTLSNRKKGIVAITKTIRGNDHYIYYSSDGTNFQRVGSPLSGLTSDSSSLFKIGKYYYYLGNNTYQISEDLINWSEEYTILNSSLSRVWGSSLYYDESNEIVYIYSAYQYEQDINTFTNDCGYTSYYFKIIYQTATINSDGTLTINQTPTDLLYNAGESYIDPYVIYDSVHGYIFAVKDETTCKISIYSMTNPYNLNQLKLTLRMKGIEAPQLLTDNKGNITMYCHDYSVIRGAWNKDNAINLQTYSKVEIATDAGFATANQALLVPTNELETFRHAGLMYCDDDMLNIIENIGIFPLELNSCSDLSLGLGYRHYSISDGLTLVNYPNVVYIFGGGQSSTQDITIKQYFKNEPLRIIVTNTKVSYNSNSDVSPSAKGQTYTYVSATEGVENINITLYGRSAIGDYGFLVPFDKS